MKKLSIGCIVVGIVSIMLAVFNALTVFFPHDTFRSLIKIILPLPGLSDFLEIVTHFRELEFLAQSISEIFFKTNIFQGSIILFIIGYILSITLAISGIGTLWRKSWGRRLGYIYSIIIFIIAIISVPVFLIYFFSLTFGGILSEFDVKKTAVWSYFILLFFYLLYPLILLFFFSRPKIKEKFKKNTGKFEGHNT